MQQGATLESSNSSKGARRVMVSAQQCSTALSAYGLAHYVLGLLLTTHSVVKLLKKGVVAAVGFGKA